MKVGSLFSGIGGIDLGLQRAGMEIAWQCEKDPWCRRILTKHWPEVPKYEDVQTLDAATVEPVDMLAGGFPCQDLSVAGKRAGLREGTRSGLWLEFARLIRALRPKYVLVENVPGLLANHALGRVLGDLAECGYDAEWENIPASALGAPHRRERVWIVAYPKQGMRQSRRIPYFNDVPFLSDWEGASEVYSLFCRGRSGPVNDRHSLRDDAGFPKELDRIAALGNAVVPQIPEMIGYAILEAEKEKP